MDWNLLYSTPASIVLDVVVLLLLVILTVVGAKRGFFKSLMSLAVIAVSLLVAVTVSRLLTDPLTDRLAPKLEDKVAKAIENADLDLAGVEFGTLNMTENHPDTLTDEEMELLQKNKGIAGLTEALEKVGVKDAKIREILAKTLKKAQNGSDNLEEGVSGVAVNITHATVRAAIRVILMVIVFILVSLLLQLLTNGLHDLMYKVRFLGTVDTVLGTFLGLITALLLIFLILTLLSGISGYQEKVDATLLTRFLDKFNLIRLLFKD